MSTMPDKAEIAKTSTTDAVSDANPGPNAGDDAAPRLMAADSLSGERVVNEAGETLGEIKHIVVDARNGVIAYAILSFGGFLGLGNKLFAVPWKSLALDVEDKWFVLNIDKHKLRDAPGFDKHHWPSMADTQWTSVVHAYYGPVTLSRRPFI